MDSRLYWIWLQQALSPGYIGSHQILRVFEDAKDVYDSHPDIFNVEGLTFEQQKKLNDKSLDKAREILALSLRNNGWILSPEDDFYPDMLRAIPGLPFVLYGRGEMPPLDIFPAISIVGTRDSTAFGRRATALISGGLALGGMVVISGGARGVDAIAHRACIEAGGITIAVQGCGLDVDYPKGNAVLRDEICKRGAIISEYPPGTRPTGSNFPVRNRIMSGLSLGVVIIEAPERSGALITAKHANDQGRDVFAVAGDMLTKRSPGTDSLIRSGAMLVTNAAEILDEYVDRFPEAIKPKNAVNINNDSRFDTRKYEKATTETKGAPRVVRKKTARVGDTKHRGVADSVDEQRSQNKKSSAKTCPDYLSEETKKVYNILTNEPTALGNIIEQASQAPPQVLTSLTELELLGLITSHPGQSYSRS